MWNMVIAIATCLGALASGAGVIVAVVRGRRELQRLRESQMENIRAGVRTVTERIDRQESKLVDLAGEVQAAMEAYLMPMANN